jgi:hypothetical protein
MHEVCGWYGASSSIAELNFGVGGAAFAGVEVRPTNSGAATRVLATIERATRRRERSDTTGLPDWI